MGGDVIAMPGYIGALTLVLVMILVLSRVILLRRHGIEAMNFGKLDPTDFLIPPFALFYFFVVFAGAFGSSSAFAPLLFQSPVLAWLGVAFCIAGLVVFVASLVSFGKSFRVGIDVEHPDQLITSGIFAYSRNPIYVAFLMILLGEFLILPNWITLLYLVGAVWLIHRQVLREEAYLKSHYGAAYLEYTQRVRRYV